MSTLPTLCITGKLECRLVGSTSGILRCLLSGSLRNNNTLKNKNVTELLNINISLH